MSDFRPISGAVHLHSVVEVDLGSGETLGRVTLESLKLNRELPQAYFSDLANLAPDF